METVSKLFHFLQKVASGTLNFFFKFTTTVVTVILVLVGLGEEGRGDCGKEWDGTGGWGGVAEGGWEKRWTGFRVTLVPSL